jgi:hypothetical protein
MDSCLRRNDGYTLGFIHQFVALFLWIPAYAGMTVILLPSSINLSSSFYGFLPMQE